MWFTSTPTLAGPVTSSGQAAESEPSVLHSASRAALPVLLRGGSDLDVRSRVRQGDHPVGGADAADARDLLSASPGATTDGEDVASASSAAGRRVIFAINGVDGERRARPSLEWSSAAVV